MNTLLDLQKQFSHTLLTQSNGISALLQNSGTTTQESAVGIYSHAYRARLLETLGTDYPLLNKILGPESFNDLALEYIEKYPSSSFSLRCFGQHLADFLKSDPIYQKQPYLAELAIFEWQLIDVFDLADSPVASIADMGCFAATDWPQVTVKLHASVRKINQRWNITSLYQAFRSETNIPDLMLLQLPQQCLIWRQQLSPHFRLLDQKEQQVLNIMENYTFAKLCHTLAELNDNADNTALEAATYLKSWLASGLIEAVAIE